MQRLSEVFAFFFERVNSILVELYPLLELLDRGVVQCGFGDDFSLEGFDSVEHLNPLLNCLIVFMAQ